MNNKDAPPETDVQRAVREFYSARMAQRGQTIAWGRDKHGRFLAEFARDAEAAWQAALRACADREEQAQAGITEALARRLMRFVSKCEIDHGYVTQADALKFLQSAALALRPDAKELEHLRAFAKDIMRAWPEGGIDGGELQEAALRHGLIEPATPTQEERDEWGLDEGDAWYRKTALLTPNG